eukprot:12294668-Alexandrium_andersonii.AAC.1
MVTSCRRRQSLFWSGPQPRAESQEAAPTARMTARGSRGAPRTPCTTPRAESAMGGGPASGPKGRGHTAVEAGLKGPVGVEHARQVGQDGDD